MTGIYHELKQRCFITCKSIFIFVCLNVLFFIFYFFSIPIHAEKLSCASRKLSCYISEKKFFFLFLRWIVVRMVHVSGLKPDHTPRVAASGFGLQLTLIRTCKIYSTSTNFDWTGARHLLILYYFPVRCFQKKKHSSIASLQKLLLECQIVYILTRRRNTRRLI